MMNGPSRKRQTETRPSVRGLNVSIRTSSSKRSHSPGMNHMDDGIFANREAVILHEAQIADAQKEIKVLKDATLNNMTNNVFLINFDSVDAVAITSGIYDPVARKLYV